MLGVEYRPFAAVSPGSRESVGHALTHLLGISGIGVTASAVYPTANLAIAIPFSLPVAARMRQLGWFNGAAVSGNVDVGIYSAGSLELLVSAGSTAQSGTTASQKVNVTDTNLPAGDYYLAIAVDNTTATLRRASAATAVLLGLVGAVQMASAFPLPATLVPATVANAYLPFPFAQFGRMM